MHKRLFRQLYDSFDYIKHNYSTTSSYSRNERINDLVELLICVLYLFDPCFRFNLIKIFVQSAIILKDDTKLLIRANFGNSGLIHQIEVCTGVLCFLERRI